MTRKEVLKIIDQLKTCESIDVESLLKVCEDWLENYKLLDLRGLLNKKVCSKCEGSGKGKINTSAPENEECEICDGWGTVKT